MRLCEYEPDGSDELSRGQSSELERTPEAAAASTGLGGGLGESSPRPPSAVDVGSEAPRLALGDDESQPWPEQTSGAQGVEPPPPIDWSLANKRDCLHCPGGRTCRKCLEGKYDAEPPAPLYSSNIHGSREKSKFKALRIREDLMIMALAALLKGLRVLCFTMTLSLEAQQSGVTRAMFSHEWGNFVRWLRYYHPDFEYYVVPQSHGGARPGGYTNDHWHVIATCSQRLPILAMATWWRNHFAGSTISGMKELRNSRGAAYYFSNYIGKGEKLCGRVMMSAHALFPGVNRLRYLYHAATGVWYPKEAIVDLVLAGREAQLAAICGYSRAFLERRIARPPYVMTRSQQREAEREFQASERACWKHWWRTRFADWMAFREVFLCKYLCESGIRARAFSPFVYPLRL